MRIAGTGKRSVAAAAILAAGIAGAGVLLSGRGAQDQGEELKRAIDSGELGTSFYFFGDGMGDSEITIARNYQVGANGPLWLDTLPFTGAYTTYALDEKNPALIDYVTDSAASGTGWSTGHKTSNGRIASIAGTGATVTRYTTILELAQDAGLQTGNVSTAELTDATPAVLDSHINDRGCQGPGHMANCLPVEEG